MHLKYSNVHMPREVGELLRSRRIILFGVVWLDDSHLEYLFSYRDLSLLTL